MENHSLQEAIVSENNSEQIAQLVSEVSQLLGSGDQAMRLPLEKIPVGQQQEVIAALKILQVALSR